MVYIHDRFVGSRYYDAGRLSDQQMALLQYQRENLHFLSEEVYHSLDLMISSHTSFDKRWFSNDIM